MSLIDLQSQGLLELLDVELARALSRMGGARDPRVELAIALTSRSVRRGHTCFPITLGAEDLWPSTETRANELPNGDTWQEALEKSPLTRGGPLVLDTSGRLYLRRYWELEQDLAGELATRAAAPPNLPARSAWLETSLERLFPGEADSAHREAGANALRHRVSLLCGGPGTGKTTTVAAIVALLIESRLQENAETPKVMLLAPTGKAAARLGEAVQHAKTRVQASEEVLEQIPEQATTVHRALGMQRDGVRFRRGTDFPLDADIIVLDEASMIDLILMRQLLAATPPDASLLIVGDPDQLTSVEAGSVLRDLVTASSETRWTGPVTELTKTYRYEADQPLGQLIGGIRMGDSALVDALLDRGDADGVAWASLDDLPDELDRAARHWAKALETQDADTHFALRRRYVMLTPFRSGRIGTHALGAATQDRLPEWREGEARVTPIIIEENSHELRVYNGDFAMLIGEEPVRAIVQSETEGFRTLAEARLPRYSEAFALSVHKAQGSEFEEVLIVLPEEDAPLLTRELVYTAVSRARKSARIVGLRAVLHAALERRAQRHSGLVDAIGRSAAPR